MDFRKHPRFEVNVPVDYSGDEIAGKGAVTNLSLGGLQFSARVPCEWAHS